jgi:hypothetical protein
MLHDVQDSDVQMVELTEDELETVTGDGGALGFGPFIAAASNLCATNFAAKTSVAASAVHQTAFFTEFQ